MSDARSRSREKNPSVLRRRGRLAASNDADDDDSKTPWVEPPDPVCDAMGGLTENKKKRLLDLRDADIQKAQERVDGDDEGHDSIIEGRRADLSLADRKKMIPFQEIRLAGLGEPLPNEWDSDAPGGGEWVKPKELLEQALSVPTMRMRGTFVEMKNVKKYMVINRALDKKGLLLICPQEIAGECGIKGARGSVGMGSIQLHAAKHVAAGTSYQPYYKDFVCVSFSS